MVSMELREARANFYLLGIQAFACLRPSCGILS